MKGYAGAKDSPFTADGWLPTRDLGWMDADGYLYVAGRKDDMIIRGGENIAPAEVEAVLGAHPAVDEVAVVGLPDVEWGQRVGAFVVLRPGERATADELGEFCRQRLASFKKPEVIRFLPGAAEEPDGQGAAARAAGAGRGRVTARGRARARPGRRGRGRGTGSPGSTLGAAGDGQRARRRDDGRRWSRPARPSSTTMRVRVVVLAARAPISASGCRAASHGRRAAWPDGVRRRRRASPSR